MFNPQARWDRHLPQDQTLPGEYVDTVVSFKKGGFYPLWFFLNGNKHTVKNINFKWQEKIGAEVLEFFSLSDLNNIRYTLCFIKSSMKWKMVEEE